MTESTILSKSDNGIKEIIINRPEALNALTPQTITELTTAMESAGADDDIGVVILTGAGRAFCAGVDLKSLGSLTSADVGADLNNAARKLE